MVRSSGRAYWRSRECILAEHVHAAKRRFHAALLGLDAALRVDHRRD